MITAKIIGAEAVKADLQRFGVMTRQNVRDAVYDSGLMLQRYIVKKKLLGQVLRRRTGRLAGSIALDPASHARDTGARIEIDVGTNVSYGKLWEMGGIIPARTIHPKHKLALFWPGARHPVKSVSQAARHVKARPFLVPSLNELRPIIRARIAAALAGVKKP